MCQILHGPYGKILFAVYLKYTLGWVSYIFAKSGHPTHILHPYLYILWLFFIYSIIKATYLLLIDFRFLIHIISKLFLEILFLYVGKGW